MKITHQDIGAHLVGLPPATQRGLHNLFNAVLTEIHELRQAAHWHGPEAVIVPLDPVQDDVPLVEPPSHPAPPAAEGALSTEPPAGDPNPGDADAPPAGSEPIVPIAVTEDGTVIESGDTVGPELAPAA